MIADQAREKEKSDDPDDISNMNITETRKLETKDDIINYLKGKM
ncbi:MAG: hypothetical protein AB2L20_11960 [Mangrovibacterium sp.]